MYSCEVNCGPLSDLTESGMQWLAKTPFNLAMMMNAVVLDPAAEVVDDNQVSFVALVK